MTVDALMELADGVSFGINTVDEKPADAAIECEKLNKSSHDKDAVELGK